MRKKHKLNKNIERLDESLNILKTKQTMLVRQSKNTFIRCTERYGYITNQLTYHDRVYNSTGSDYLKVLSREPQDVENLIDKLLELYEDVSREELAEICLLDIANYIISLR